MPKEITDHMSIPEMGRYNAEIAEKGVIGALMLMAGTLPFAGITIFREIGLLAGLFFWIYGMATSRSINFHRTTLDIPFILLLLTALISLATAVDFYYSLSEIRGELLKGMLMFYLAAMNIKTEKQAKLIILCLLIGTLVMDAYTVVHFLLYGHLGFGETGLHSNAPELGTFLIQSAPFIILGLLYSKRLNQRILFAAFLLLHIVATYFTFSRMSMLVLIFELFLFTTLWFKSWKICFIAFVAATIFFQVMGARPVIVFDRTKAETSSMDLGKVIISGEGNRLLLWKISLEKLASNPFRGIGYGRHSFKMKFPELKKYNKRFWHAHNVFIDAGLQLGIQGLAAFLILVYSVFRYLWPKLRIEDCRKRVDCASLIIAAAFISTAGLFTRNLTDDLFNNDAALLAWLIVGMGFALRRKELETVRA